MSARQLRRDAEETTAAQGAETEDHEARTVEHHFSSDELESAGLIPPQPETPPTLVLNSGAFRIDGSGKASRRRMVAPPPPEDGTGAWAPNAASALSSLVDEEIAQKSELARAEALERGTPGLAGYAPTNSARQRPMLSSPLAAPSARRPSGKGDRRRAIALPLLAAIGILAAGAVGGALFVKLSQTAPAPRDATHPVTPRAVAAAEEEKTTPRDAAAPAVAAAGLMPSAPRAALPAAGTTDTTTAPAPVPAPPAVPPATASASPGAPAPAPAAAATEAPPSTAIDKGDSKSEAATASRDSSTSKSSVRTERKKKKKKRTRKRRRSRRKKVASAKSTSATQARNKSDVDAEFNKLLEEPSKSAALPATLSKSQVLGVVRIHAGEVKRCHESHVKQGGSAVGSMTMKWNIKPTGRTASVGSVDGAAGSTLARCVTSVVESMRFPRFDGDNIPVRFPFRF